MSQQIETTADGAGTGNDSLAASADTMCLTWVFPIEETLELGGRPVTIGRGEDCSVRLQGAEVSRLHARIYRQGPVWVLTDSESRNGTFWNGRRVAHQVLSRGGVVRLGGHIGVVGPGARDARGTKIVEVTPGFWLSETAQREVSGAFRVAASKLPVVVVGETGTGKERLAKALHYRSDRNGPFVAVNCAAIPTELAESVFFGHQKGAFTGAHQASSGYLVNAKGGTLFLDELADLPLHMQAKLLRALQEQEVVPVGASLPVRVDLRIITALQHPIEHYVETGRMREDFAMRLNGIQVRLPPLRERVLEIPALFSMFVKRALGDRSVPAVEPRLVEALCLSPWPGNVRQLELLAQRLVALAPPGKPLAWSDLPETFRQSEGPSIPAMNLERRESDKARLQKALGECAGNVSLAARRLGMSRQRAYRLLEQSDLEGLRHSQSEGEGDRGSG